MTIYFATSNPGKVQDAQNILETDIEQLDIDVVEPCIKDLEKIAAAKTERAVQNSQLLGCTVFADDSGLFIEQLDGFPGQHTAFFDRTVGKEQLLNLVEPGAHAEFRAAIGVYDPETGDITTFTGSCEGTIVEPRGDGGFGYDPMFLPADHEKTFAEDTEYKHQVSHRKEALKQLKAWLEER